MTMDRKESLWARFLAGDPLAPSEQRELVEALEADPKALSAFVRDARLHGQLKGLGESSGDAKAFQESLSRCLDSERDGDRFLRRVEAGIERESAGPDRSSKPNVGRPALGPHRWNRRPGAVGPGAWVGSGAIAALFLGAILLIVSFSSSSTTSRNFRTAPTRVAPAEERSDATRLERERWEKELALKREELRQLEEARRQDQDEQKASELKERERELTRAADEFKARLETLDKREGASAPANSLDTASTAQPPAKPSEDAGSATRHRPAVFARVERAEGSRSVSGETRTELKGGEEILAGHGLEVAKGKVCLRCPDGTFLEVGADTVIDGFQAAKGKRLVLSRGKLHAKVSRQPEGQPMVIATPQGEATVLGTTLRIVVDPDPKKGTRLEVLEGKVKLKNLGGKTVDVPSGHYAVAAAGVGLPKLEICPPRNGLALWLSAESTSQAGGRVQAVADLSGNNCSATQLAPQMQPLLVPKAINGRPALRFDGDDDHLKLAPLRSDLSAGLCLFLVVRTPVEPKRMRLLDLWGNHPMSNIYVDLGIVSEESVNTFSVRLYGVGGDGAGWTQAKLVDPRNEVRVLAATLDATGTMTLTNNGVALDARRLTPPLPGPRSKNLIGTTASNPRAFAFEGDLAEILLYSRDLSAVERECVQSHLDFKYRN